MTKLIKMCQPYSWQDIIRFVGSLPYYAIKAGLIIRWGINSVKFRSLKHILKNYQKEAQEINPDRDFDGMIEEPYFL